MPDETVTPVAVQFTAPGTVELVPEERPVLEEGTVRVQTLFSGVSAGTELTAFRGSNVYLERQWDPDTRLFTPTSGRATFDYPLVGWGYSEVGRVVEVADDVHPGTIAAGELVHGVWGHRSQAVVAADDISWRRLPPAMDPMSAIFTRVGAIALNAVLGADLHLDERVAIFGQGVIGLLATRLAVLGGARVVAVDGVDLRLRQAAAMGAEWLVDFRDGSSAEQIRADIGHVDAVIELSGNGLALSEAIRTAPVGGRVVAAGFYQGPSDALRLGDEFHHNRVQLVASQIGGVPTGLADRWSVTRLHQVVDRRLGNGDLPVEGLITHVVPAADAQVAYDELDRGARDVLQVVLDFRDTDRQHDR